jgi:SEC-C motif-containing protein
MRSRYSAYALGEIDYLTNSLHPESRHDHDATATRRWAEQSQWLGLEVRQTERGVGRDLEGRVEFIARYRDKSGVHRHHEIGHFKKDEGQWFYLEGSSPSPVSSERGVTKVGRNQPCPCGSGRKYKKCCG